MKRPNTIQFFVLVFALICSMSLILSNPHNSHAQAADWSAVLFFRNETGGVLHTVNANSIMSTIPISSNLLVDGTTGASIFITSPDGHYILYRYYLQGDTFGHLRFGATGDGPCCTDMSEVVSGISEYSLAGFEPNGSRFALSYIRMIDEAPFFTGGMMVVDAVAATVVADISMEQAVADLNLGEIPNWAQMGRWTTDGIQFIGNCFACGGGYLEGEYSLWNPDTDTIVAQSGVAYSDFGVALQGTGEFIRRGQDTRFPYDPSPGVFEIPNAVQYYPSANFDAEAITIYADADTTNLGGIAWVGDGQAVLVVSPSGAFWDIIFRSDRTERIQETPQPRFMGGTPDGWFAATTIDGQQSIVHYSIDTLEATLVAQFPEEAISAQFTYLPALGFNIDPVRFVAMTPPDVAQTAQCPGALPSRLVVGQSARVLPGSPNRIREYPGVDAPIVGEIPSGATFSVISGPTCDGTTVTWWYIDYDGTTGWTAEGLDDTYFTEPLE